MLKFMIGGLLSHKSAPAAFVPPQPSNDFLGHLMERFFAHFGHAETDNFDYERFGISHGSLVMPDYRVLFPWFQILRQRSADMERGRDLLEDDTSRRLYEDLLLYRLLLHPYMRLPSNTPEHWAMREQARGYRTGTSDLSLPPLTLQRYHIDFYGEPIDLQCCAGNIAWTFLIKQYFFARDGVRVQVEPGDIVIDAGALFGDTALAFAAAAGKEGRVFAFDIMPAHLEIIRANLATNPALAARIEAVEVALADNSADTLYIHGNGPGARVSPDPSDRPVTVTTIDDFVADRKLPRVDFIKMDIEGAEGPALSGAINTIKRHRPKLAISLYHRPTDICDLPLLIDAMGVDYVYYLDHYTIHTEETVLYAVPRT